MDKVYVVVNINTDELEIVFKNKKKSWIYVIDRKKCDEEVVIIEVDLYRIGEYHVFKTFLVALVIIFIIVVSFLLAIK